MLSRIQRSLKEEMPFFAAAFQLLLLVLVIQVFHFEGARFARSAWLIFGGFVIQRFLPMHLRLGFFVLLSIAALFLEAGGNGVWVLLIGGILVGICHLPFSLWIRTALLLTTGAGLAWLRATPSSSVLLPQEIVWTIFGAMFMFRLAAYVYDRQHEPSLGSPLRAAAYFFMLPNASFPLYPPIDYKTFCGSYYSVGEFTLYQTGLRWIGRGLVQLVLYRVVMQIGFIELEDVRTLTDVARHVLMTYLLYLRISGQFHIIVGTLHLFGFNLPETHHRYLLASSFTDYWRRINIYWKDYLTRMFFYPIYFRIKSWGHIRALTVATILTFAITWILHSYQWFWLRGRFVLSWQDTIFWWALAGFVLYDALREAKKGRTRSLTAKRPTWRSHLQLALRTIVVFILVCGLWTMWSCKSYRELVWLARRALVAGPWDLLIVASGLLAIGGAAILWGRSTREQSSAPAGGVDLNQFPTDYWHSWRLGVANLAALLILGWIPALKIADGNPWMTMLASLRADRPSSAESERLVRGYYEELNQEVEVGGVVYEGSRLRNAWTSVMSRLKLQRSDALGYELQPSRNMSIAGSQLTTNEFGMRDGKYTKQKPAGCCRLVVVGASCEMGWGIGDGQTYEQLAEEDLQKDVKRGDFPSIKSFEMLNLSVPGHGIHQKLMMVEERAFEFEPDAILFVTYPEEFSRTADRVGDLIEQGHRMPFDRMQSVLDEAGLKSGLSDVALRSQIKQCRKKIVGEALLTLAEISRKRDVPVYVILYTCPIPPTHPTNERNSIHSLIEASGLPILSLEHAFDQVTDRVQLVVSPFDLHPNRRGHALLATDLAQQIRRDVMPKLQHSASR
jgi:hypothetical protein